MKYFLIKIVLLLNIPAGAYLFCKNPFPHKWAPTWEWADWNRDLEKTTFVVNQEFYDFFIHPLDGRLRYLLNFYAFDFIIVDEEVTPYQGDGIQAIGFAVLTGGKYGLYVADGRFGQYERDIKLSTRFRQMMQKKNYDHPDYELALSVLEHELLHVFGLGHFDDYANIMHKHMKEEHFYTYHTGMLQYIACIFNKEKRFYQE